MMKAKLIKREEAMERQQEKKARIAQQKTAKKTVEIVHEWLDQRQIQKLNPRAAFAALFAQPQPE